MELLNVSTDIMICIETYEILRLQDLKLHIKGWAFSKKSKKPLNIKILEIKAENIKVIKYKRQDVYNSYSNYEGAINSGFTIIINDIKDVENIKIKFKDKTNKKIKILNINVQQLIKKNITLNSNQFKNSELELEKFEEYPKYDILFFSIIDWEYRYQRPQHLATNMAEQGHRVFYFNANFLHQDLVIKKINKRLNILTLPNKFGIRIYDIDFTSKLQDITKQLDQIIQTNNIKDCILFVQYPTWVPLLEHLKKKYNFKIIFDYLDEFEGFKTRNNLLVNTTNQLFKISDLVISTSEYLYDKAKEKNDIVTIVRNGTEYEHFNAAIKNKEVKIIKRPIIGYYGAIAEWFDVDKIKYMANKNPEWDIILIGDYTYADVTELKKLSNVKLLGEKHYKDLPDYLKDFDVCIIPFKADTNLIKATNPVKFYEYLSAGKKIVATEIPELEKFKDKLTLLSNDNEKFVEYIKQCLKNTDGLASVEEKLKFAQMHTWKERGEKIRNSIKKVHDLVSIIIVTFNNLEYTKECIQSILEKTAYPNYELVIVDNKSQDDTQSYLKEIEKQYSNITIILNEENYGFAKANNIGINRAKGNYIIFLNNDTVVTRGWITGFIKHLKRDPLLGLIGPVTNWAGNEAKINVPYKNIKDMDKFAESYTSANLNLLYKDIKTLAFFCVALKKEIIDEVGYLDEDFGIGMFEDDDYSYRVKKAGYKIACAEDVFIHHYGRASMKKISVEDYEKLFKKNKEIFEQKWNIKWVPHKYRETVK